jgi:cell division inhibitor SepF
MGIFDELKRMARPFEDEDDDFEEYEAAPRAIERRDRQERYERPERVERAPRSESYPSVTNLDDERRSNKVVNIRAATQLQVVLVKPDKFDDASAIADHLREKRTVVLNLESTNKEIARRLLDFLSGVAYANEGKIKKVAISTYIITPYNVDILGDLTDELVNNGLYF